jgi:hypothetical protein
MSRRPCCFFAAGFAYPRPCSNYLVEAADMDPCPGMRLVLGGLFDALRARPQVAALLSAILDTDPARFRDHLVALLLEGMTG